MGSSGIAITFLLHEIQVFEKLVEFQRYSSSYGRCCFDIFYCNSGVLNADVSEKVNLSALVAFT